MLSRLIASALLLSGAFAAECQLPPKSSPTELRHILEVSRGRGQLEMEGGQPFHMIASFEYLVADGKTEKGTLHELWQDAHHFRQEITIRGQHLVEVDKETQRWRTGEWAFSGGVMDAIEAVVMPFYPLPEGDRLSVEGQQHGSKDLDCIGTEPTVPGVSPTSALAETTFCMSRGNHLLRMVAEPNHVTISYGDTQEFQGKHIARSVEVYTSTRLWARLHVDSLTPATDFSALADPPRWRADDRVPPQGPAVLRRPHAWPAARWRDHAVPPPGA